ncbi:MAG: hypothetical protein LUE91_00070, partial [Oscillospiraceae bacterium]|nr:hypothetical protein [Oscillospiraceae bacterium]
RSSGLCTHAGSIDLFGLLSGHQLRQFNPSVVRIQMPTERQSEIDKFNLVIVPGCIHSAHPKSYGYSPKLPFLAAFIIHHFGLYCNFRNRFSSNLD